MSCPVERTIREGKDLEKQKKVEFTQMASEYMSTLFLICVLSIYAKKFSTSRYFIVNSRNLCKIILQQVWTRRDPKLGSTAIYPIEWTPIDLQLKVEIMWVRIVSNWTWVYSNIHLFDQKPTNTWQRWFQNHEFWYQPYTYLNYPNSIILKSTYNLSFILDKSILFIVSVLV